MRIQYYYKIKNKLSLIPKTIGLNCLIAVLITIAIFGCSSTTEKKQITTENIEKKDTLKPIVDSTKKEAPQTSIPKKEIVHIYNDNARFIAGLKSEPESEFKKFEKNNDWQHYSAWSNAIWNKLNEGQIKKVKTWADNELSFNSTSETTTNNLKLFYPFSGADFLYANTLFPNANEYLMIGLEPVGKVPDIRKIPEDFWENYFLALKTSMDDILTASFFKTKDMRKDFTAQELKGTLPILMIFIVRTGHKIVTIEPVEISDSGKIIDSRLDKIAHHQHNKMHGIRITFENDSTINNAQNNQKTVYYFSIDLSNQSLSQKPEFKLFLNSYGKTISFIKSASYLMHSTNFSTIRSLILKHSYTHIQDDSGIPLKYFYTKENDNTWQEPIFYGGYKAPIPMFKNYYQEDFKNKFADTTKTKPLPFRIGYQNLAKQSNLIIVKKEFHK